MPDIVVEEFVDLSILNEPQVIVEEPIDEIVHDMKNEKNFVFPLRKEQKKVDIKKLKYNIKSRIESKKNSKLREIYRDIPKIYTEKEANLFIIFYNQTILKLFFFLNKYFKLL